MRSLAFILLLVVSVLGITPPERAHLRDTILQFARLNLAQRVVPFNPGIRDSGTSSELELSAIRNLTSKLMSSIPHTDVHRKYVLDQGRTLVKEFSTYLSLGFVKVWPRYYHDPKFGIQILPEVLQVVPEHDASDDFGPEVPDLGTVKAEPRVFEGPRWVSGTPEGYRMPYIYELVHILPLKLLMSFHEVLSATWRTLSRGERQKMSAPLRVLKRTSEMAKRVLKGHLPDFKYDLLWAPGNLYWGFKDRPKKEGFDTRVEEIIGNKRFRRAERIYNNVLGFMDRANATREPMPKVVENVKSDESLMTEMKELLYKLSYFGLERAEPYPVDVSQWENHGHREIWFWVIQPSVGVNHIDFGKNLALVLYAGVCYSLSSSRTKRSLSTSSEYDRFEDSLIRGIVTNDVNAILVFKELRRKLPERAWTSLADVDGFVRGNMREHNLNRECPRDDVFCSRLEDFCGYPDDTITLGDDSGPDSLKIDVADYVASTSFPDWCAGRHFSSKNKITTDSAFARVLTFDANNRNSSLNIEMRDELYDEFLTMYTDNEDASFFDFVEDQLHRHNSTANKILNQACRRYKESPKVEKSEDVRKVVNGNEESILRKVVVSVLGPPDTDAEVRHGLRRR